MTSALDLLSRLRKAPAPAALPTGSSALDLLKSLQASPTPMAPATEAAPKPASPLQALQALASSSASKKVRTESQRILEIPKWSREDFKGLDLTEEYQVPGGTWRLHPIQSLALHWIRETGGLLGPMAVGTGKTLVTLLAPAAAGAQRPMLLVPPTMQIPLRREIAKYKKHFKMPRNLIILPYSVLSQASSTGLLGGSEANAMFPDLIIADEVHHLRHDSAARTKRLLRYFQRFPQTGFVAVSGTLTSRGLKDYAHLAELALRDNSPLPLEERELIAWSNCIDARADARPQDWSLFAEFHDLRKVDEEHRTVKAREAFRERLVTTPGVVATQEGSVEASLVMKLRPIEIPRAVREALFELNKTWCRPDGEELATALDKWRVTTQLVQGFYYYWDWPNGIVDHEWMSARAFWHKEVRRITSMNIEGLDSKLLVRNAILSGVLRDPTAVAAWHGWEAVRHRPQPPTKTQWIDDYLLRDAVRWLEAHPGGLVWYRDICVRDRLAGITNPMEKLALAGSGDGFWDNRSIEVYSSNEDVPVDGRSMALSIDAHGTGLNLQANHENLILSFPSSGKTCEQLLGRTHRYGQEEDEVSFTYYAPTPDAQASVEKAKEDARYIQQTQGSPQKLCYATWTTED